MKNFSSLLSLCSLLALGLAPRDSRACACGCGVFEVGTSSMLPDGSGATVFLEDDYQDQDQNWSGSSAAPAANNPDKDLRTNFLTAGFQDMFTRSWGLQVEVPYDTRTFSTTGGPTGTDPVTLKWSGMGDIRLQGIYAGFSPDLSTGVTFGVKLPNGDYTQNDAFGDIDRDSEVATGSTDLLLGGFHRGLLAGAPRWTWFVDGQLDLPMLTRAHYRPGLETDAALGAYYGGWSLGTVTVTPVAQLKASLRARDRGAAADPVSSGFERVLLAPGVELNLHPVKIYADVERQVYQDLNGDQLAARALFKLSVSRMF